MWVGNGRGLFLASGNQRERVVKVKSFKSWIKTDNMDLNSNTATPSKMLWMISGGSPDVTWKYS